MIPRVFCLQWHLVMFGPVALLPCSTGGQSRGELSCFGLRPVGQPYGDGGVGRFHGSGSLWGRLHHLQQQRWQQTFWQQRTHKAQVEMCSMARLTVELTLLLSFLRGQTERATFPFYPIIFTTCLDVLPLECIGMYLDKSIFVELSQQTPPLIYAKLYKKWQWNNAVNLQLGANIARIFFTT